LAQYTSLVLGSGTSAVLKYIFQVMVLLNRVKVHACQVLVLGSLVLVLVRKYLLPRGKFFTVGKML